MAGMAAFGPVGALVGGLGGALMGGVMSNLFGSNHMTPEEAREYIIEQTANIENIDAGFQKLSHTTYGSNDAMAEWLDSMARIGKIAGYTQDQVWEYISSQSALGKELVDTYGKLDETERRFISLNTQMATASTEGMLQLNDRFSDLQLQLDKWSMGMGATQQELVDWAKKLDVNADAFKALYEQYNLGQIGLEAFQNSLHHDRDNAC